MRGEGPCPQQAQRDGKSERQHRAPHGHAHRHQALPGVFAQMRQGRMEVALEEDTNIADIAQQFERTQLHDLSDIGNIGRSEEHTSELQSLTNLVCRLLLEKKKKEPSNESSSAATLSQ